MPLTARFTRLLRVHLPLAFTWLCVFSTMANSTPPADPFVAAGADDASLNAVCAPTPDRVWAVGDRGVILTTADGGRKWTRQESGTTANLYAVAFKDSSEGCAVGGLPGPLSRTSRSVVLRTVNGGATWNIVPTDGLPRFTGMRAIGGRLIAWGDYCPQRKTAIFFSHDGGQVWQPMDSSVSHVAALGVDPSGNLIAVDRVGNAYNSQLGALRSFFTVNPHQPLAFIEHLGSTWLAGGADGQLMRTVDAQSWSRVALPISSSAQRVCQWRTVTRFDDHLWVAGSPGSIVLHSADRGVNWEVLSTDQTLPLRALVFVDAQRGWGVGPLGTIIATRDGGRTWYVQRKTATRVGLLAVTASETQTPWPVLVATSWGEVVAAKSLSLFADGLEQSADYRVETWQINEALAPQIGTVEHNAWLYPKPMGASSGDLTQLAERLAVELQCWRPDVLLTDETGGQLNDLPNRAALAAITAAMQVAAEANSQAIAGELKLPAWRTTKLATTTLSRNGQYSEQVNRLMREPGLAIWDVLQPRGLIYDASAPTIPMRTIQQVNATLASNSSLFGGIAPSQASRRQINLRNLGNYQLIMGRVHRMSAIDNLVTLPNETPIAEWQTQLDFVLRSLPPREVAPALMRIAGACAIPTLGARRQIAYERLVQLQPDSDVASHARIKLLQMLSSEELRAWRESGPTDLLGNQSVGSLRTDSNQSFNRSITSTTPFDVVTASSNTPLTSPMPSRDKELANNQADSTLGANPPTVANPKSEAPVKVAAFTADSSSRASAESKLQALQMQRVDTFFKAIDSCYKADPYLASLPQLELMREAMTRGRSGIARSQGSSTALLESLVGLTALAGWPQAAKQELMMVKDRPENLRWVAFAVATENRPLLDGVLNEPMWAACPPMKLTRPVGNLADIDQSPALIRWSFDDRFLYIAIEGTQERRELVNARAKLRKYDSDLSAADHVHLMIDTDRDYTSAIELGVSSEGETFDRCCEIPQYNPQYPVAVPSVASPDRWVVEIAIRISDLTTRTELVGQAWAVSAHRRKVNGEIQSWSSMVSEQPTLQSAGLLLFVQPPEK